MNRRSHLIVLGALLSILLLICWDLVTDYAEGVSPAHVALELAVLIIACGAAALLLRLLQRERQSSRLLEADLETARRDSAQWRQQTRRLVAGLGAAIAGRFREWGLSEAESEVGLLILKGLSLKEIANLRHTSERTVREQARAVYRKAGISGRAGLSAYFLEDLLPATLEDGAARAVTSGPGWLPHRLTRHPLNTKIQAK